MNVFAKFDEIPSMTLQDIKETKCYRHTFVRSFGRTDNVKTVYPPTNTVCGGYNYAINSRYLVNSRNSLKTFHCKLVFAYHPQRFSETLIALRGATFKTTLHKMLTLGLWSEA